jgi:hypothetical protein
VGKSLPPTYRSISRTIREMPKRPTGYRPDLGREARAPRVDPELGLGLKTVSVILRSPYTRIPQLDDTRVNRD